MTVTGSNFARKENDLYETEPWATRALLRNVDVQGRSIWEPAAGNHLIADVLKMHGAIAHTSDIETYARQHDRTIDFLVADPPSRCDFIITNPPYGSGNRLAVKFVEHSLAACDGTVAMLLTAKFDFGKTRKHLFKNNERFRAKIALLDRLSLTLDGKTGTEDHAWYIWTEPSHHQPICLYEGKEAAG